MGGGETVRCVYIWAAFERGRKGFQQAPQKNSVGKIYVLYSDMNERSHFTQSTYRPLQPIM
jgi:hypothetical protein